MKHARSLFFLVPAGLALALAACGRGGASGPEAGKPAVAVEAEAARTATLTDGVDVVGTLAPKNETVIKPEYRGVVEEVYVDEWVPVRRGQPLARLDMREVQASYGRSGAAVEMAEAQVMQAEVAEARAERDYKRLLELAPHGIISQQEIDNGQSALEAARAQTAAARAALAASREDFSQAGTMRSKRTIVSPIDGVVAACNVEVGTFVSDGAPPQGAFRIVDNRLLELTVMVPSTELARITPGLSLVFTTDALPGQAFTATVKRVNPSVDAQDRAVRVTAEIPNESGVLRSGLFVKGRIVTGTRANAVLVPRTALLNWRVEEGKADVLVVKGEAAERREVRVGVSEEDDVEILQGLAAGEKVVTVGGFNVAEGDRLIVSNGDAPAASPAPAPSAAETPSSISPASAMPGAPDTKAAARP